MSMETPADTLTTAAFGLALGFPALELVLSEAIQYLRQQGRPLAGTLQLVRNLLIPALAALIFLTYILHLDPESRAVRFVETVLWICTLVSTLSLFDILLFSESDEARQIRARRASASDADADADRWQARIPKLFRDLARVFLILVGAAIILSATWNIDLGGLVAALGVGSVVIGLALQDTLGSIAAGIALLFEQPFKKGDWLKVGESEGKVTDINWRAVRIETIDNVQINIPHLIIGKETITNYSQPIKAHEEEIFLRYAYRHPPNLVKQVLKATALATPGILTEPEVEVETVKYEDSGISYRVSFYIDGYQDRLKIRDEYQTRIWYANQRYNLRIPHPIREIHQMDMVSPEVAQGEKVSMGLQSMPVLVDIEAESFADLTKEAILNTFAAGEEVFAEGDHVQALYLILAGRAEASVRDASGQQRITYSLSRGDFFGEISLFTGQPSGVTIRATEDLEVMLIAAAMAQALVDRKPSLARELGLTIETRTKLIEATRMAATTTS
jgi:small-conductance mechanosensitive channel